jgi:hypothetical protein
MSPSLKNQVETNLKNGKCYETFANLNKSLEIEPNNSHALSIRGETYYMIDKFEEFKYFIRNSTK